MAINRSTTKNGQVTLDCNFTDDYDAGNTPYMGAMDGGSGTITIYDADTNTEIGGYPDHSEFGGQVLYRQVFSGAPKRVKVVCSYGSVFFKQVDAPCGYVAESNDSTTPSTPSTSPTPLTTFGHITSATILFVRPTKTSTPFAQVKKGTTGASYSTATVANFENDSRIQIPLNIAYGTVKISDTKQYSWNGATEIPFKEILTEPVFNGSGTYHSVELDQCVTDGSITIDGNGKLTFKIQIKWINNKSANAGDLFNIDKVGVYYQKNGTSTKIKISSSSVYKSPSEQWKWGYDSICTFHCLIPSECVKGNFSLWASTNGSNYLELKNFTDNRTTTVTTTPDTTPTVTPNDDKFDELVSCTYDSLRDFNGWPKSGTGYIFKTKSYSIDKLWADILVPYSYGVSAIPTSDSTSTLNDISSNHTNHQALYRFNSTNASSIYSILTNTGSNKSVSKYVFSTQLMPTNISSLLANVVCLKFYNTTTKKMKELHCTYNTTPTGPNYKPPTTDPEPTPEPEPTPPPVTPAELSAITKCELQKIMTKNKWSTNSWYYSFSGTSGPIDMRTIVKTTGTSGKYGFLGEITVTNHPTGATSITEGENYSTSMKNNYWNIPPVPTADFGTLTSAVQPKTLPSGISGDNVATITFRSGKAKFISLDKSTGGTVLKELNCTYSSSKDPIKKLPTELTNIKSCKIQKILTENGQDRNTVYYEFTNTDGSKPDLSAFKLKYGLVAKANFAPEGTKTPITQMVVSSPLNSDKISVATGSLGNYWITPASVKTDSNSIEVLSSKLSSILSGKSLSEFDLVSGTSPDTWMSQFTFIDLSSYTGTSTSDIISSYSLVKQLTCTYSATGDPKGTPPEDITKLKSCTVQKILMDNGWDYDTLYYTVTTTDGSTYNIDDLKKKYYIEATARLVPKGSTTATPIQVKSPMNGYTAVNTSSVNNYWVNPPYFDTSITNAIQIHKTQFNSQFGGQNLADFSFSAGSGASAASLGIAVPSTHDGSTKLEINAFGQKKNLTCTYTASKDPKRDLHSNIGGCFIRMMTPGQCGLGYVILNDVYEGNGGNINYTIALYVNSTSASAKLTNNSGFTETRLNGSNNYKTVLLKLDYDYFKSKNLPTSAISKTPDSLYWNLTKLYFRDEAFKSSATTADTTYSSPLSTNFIEIAPYTIQYMAPENGVSPSKFTLQFIFKSSTSFTNETAFTDRFTFYTKTRSDYGKGFLPELSSNINTSYIKITSKLSGTKIDCQINCSAITNGILIVTDSKYPKHYFYFDLFLYSVSAEPTKNASSIRTELKFTPVGGISSTKYSNPADQVLSKTITPINLKGTRESVISTSQIDRGKKSSRILYVPYDPATSKKFEISADDSYYDKAVSYLATAEIACEIEAPRSGGEDVPRVCHEGVLIAPRTKTNFADITEDKLILGEYLNEMKDAISNELKIRKLAPAKAWVSAPKFFNEELWLEIKREIDRCREFDIKNNRPGINTNNVTSPFRYPENYTAGEVISVSGTKKLQEYIGELQGTCICQCDFDCQCDPTCKCQGDTIAPCPNQCSVGSS